VAGNDKIAEFGQNVVLALGLEEAVCPLFRILFLLDEEVLLVYGRLEHQILVDMVVHHTLGLWDL
jgi:hypothetical protein